MGGFDASSLVWTHAIHRAKEMEPSNGSPSLRDADLHLVGAGWLGCACQPGGVEYGCCHWTHAGRWLEGMGGLRIHALTRLPARSARRVAVSRFHCYEQTCDRGA